jgi:hypothetical protein
MEGNDQKFPVDDREGTVGWPLHRSHRWVFLSVRHVANNLQQVIISSHGESPDITTVRTLTSFEGWIERLETTGLSLHKSGIRMFKTEKGSPGTE